MTEQKRMTAEQIEAMTDDQVDIYIAKEILGMTWKTWSDTNEGEDASEGAYGCWERDERSTNGRYDCYYVGIPDCHSWSPANCIDDGMRIVLRSDHSEFVLSCKDDMWLAGDWRLPACGTAKTPARAICNSLINNQEAKKVVYEESEEL
jgi:hypothetical protein